MRTLTTFPISGLILSGLAVAGLCGQVGAADTESRDSPTDIRLNAIQLDSSYDYKASGNVLGIPLSADGSSNWDKSWRGGLVVQSMHNHPDDVLGLSTGLGLYYTQLENNGNSRERFEAVSAQLRIGAAIVINNNIHLELLPLAGVGAARGKLGDVKSGDPDLYWEYGAEAGAYVTLSNVQFGVQAGWLRSRLDIKFDDRSQFNGAPIDNAELKIRTDGPYVGVSIGMRL